MPTTIPDHIYDNVLADVVDYLMGVRGALQGIQNAEKIERVVVAHNFCGDALYLVSALLSGEIPTPVKLTDPERKPFTIGSEELQQLITTRGY